MFCPPPSPQPVIYGAGFWITIEKLTPDFLGVTGEMFDGFRGNQSEWGFEAPVMFKRQGLYYILFGPFCCFCYQVRNRDDKTAFLDTILSINTYRTNNSPGLWRPRVHLPLPARALHVPGPRYRLPGTKGGRAAKKRFVVIAFGSITLCDRADARAGVPVLWGGPGLGHTRAAELCD